MPLTGLNAAASSTNTPDSGPPDLQNTETSATALSATPNADTNYVNVVLQIDPNWPWLSKIDGQTQSLFTRMVFIFLDNFEEGFTENVSVSYASSDVVGRDEQYKTYTGTDNRQVPLSIRFIAQGPGGSGSYGQDFLDALTAYDPTKDVVKPARWIESLQHPVIDPATGLSYAPPPLLLTIGKLFAGRVILTDCSTRWDSPFEPGSMLPHGATLSCTFTVVRNAQDVAGSNAYSDVDDLSAFFADKGPVFSQFVEFPSAGPKNTGGST